MRRNAGSLAAIAPAAVILDRRADELRDEAERLAAERAIDVALADSFPASDPPSWSAGITRPHAGDDVAPRASGALPRTEAGESGNGPGDFVDVSRPSRGGVTLVQGLTSLAGAAGIALAVPFVILLVGLPVALAVRGVLELVGWMLGVTVR